MAASPGFSFGAIGINHGHIYGQTEVMLAAGCQLKSFHALEDDLAAAYSAKFPDAKRVTDERAILEDPEIRLVIGAGILADRAPMAIRAMRHDKDVMLDKPGATTLEQLGELRRTQAETGRILSILYSEHYTQRATVTAGELVREGAIGRVLQTVGLGPHRIGNYDRPDWFWTRERTGGILCDIGSHQVEQFLFFTGSDRAEVAASYVANFDHPDRPGFEDFGDILLRSDHATGYIRVDWFTQDGLPTWGDGRLFILGTDGTIELRKYVDVAGRPGGDHLFLVDRAGVRHVDCSNTRIVYGERLRDDVLNRTETAMPQAHCFLATELALTAQAKRHAHRRRQAKGERVMTVRLKVGVVGGGVGVNHINAYKDLADLYSVEAFCDIDPVRAEKIAGEHSIPATTTDFDAFLDYDLDVVDICTPSALHYEQARKALLAGRHVLVEKPFASSLAEADQLAHLEQRSGKRVCPVFQYRFGDGLAQLFHLRERGFVGKAYVATVETHWRRLPAYYDNPWRGRWATELGGGLITHAIHNHDMLTQVLGPIRSVFARTATRVNPIETEDCAAALLEMADGSLVTLSVTLGAEENMSRLRFCFEGLTAESNHSPYNAGTAPWRFVAADPQRQQAIDAAVVEVVPRPERYHGLFMRLHRALTEGGELPVSIADARPSLELAAAAYHSARAGQMVQLPISRNDPIYGGWLPEQTRESA